MRLSLILTRLLKLTESQNGSRASPNEMREKVRSTLHLGKRISPKFSLKRLRGLKSTNFSARSKSRALCAQYERGSKVRL